MRHFILTLVFLITVFTSIKASPPNTKFGKISDDEWQMTECPFDTSASAVILMEEARIFYGADHINYFVHKRIKIFDENGYDYAFIQIPYVGDESQEWIERLKAYTYVKDENGKVTRQKVTDVQEEKLSGSFYWKKFTFPGLQPGAIIEFQYTKVGPVYFNIDTWYFQHEIPTMYSRFKYDLPNLFNFKFIPVGVALARKYPSLKFNSKKVWDLENIEGFKDVPYLIGSRSFINQLKFQLISLTGDDGQIHPLIDTWDNLAKGIRTTYDLILRKGKNDATIISEALEGATDAPAMMKLRKLYAYMKAHFKWNEHYGRFPSNKIKKLKKDKVGSATDLNLYLVGLLHGAGIEAYPALISTRRHGKPDPSFPLLSQFNKVICYAVIDGKGILIDIANNNDFLPMEFLPEEDLNYLGWVLVNQENTWVEIPVKGASKLNTFVELDYLEQKGIMKGRSSGYIASKMRIRTAAGDDFLAFSDTEGFAGYAATPDMSAITTKGTAFDAKSFVFEIPIELDELDEEDFLYFNPLSWTDLANNPFDAPERSFPIEFDYPYSFKYYFKIVPPEEYEIDFLPEALAIQLPDKLGKFIYSAKPVNGYIAVDFTFNINTIFMTTEAYPYLKEFYKKMTDKLQETIVLKKK